MVKFLLDDLRAFKAARETGKAVINGCFCVPGQTARVFCVTR